MMSNRCQSRSEASAASESGASSSPAVRILAVVERGRWRPSQVAHQTLGGRTRSSRKPLLRSSLAKMCRFDGFATMSRALGFTRARMTQLMDLLVIAPEIPEEILFLELPAGAQPVSERALREALC